MAATRLLLNVFIAGGAVFGKALVEAWRQASVKAAQGVTVARGLTVQEAQKILGLRAQYDMKEVLQVSLASLALSPLFSPCGCCMNE